MCWAVMRRPLLLLAAALLLACALPARAQTQVDLLLALAVDASGSVSMGRFELQKRGYADAFRNPRVQQAIRSGSTSSIAVAMYQWTGPGMQVPVIPWTIVRDAETVEALAGAIERTDRHLFGGGTSISGAIDFGMALLDRSPYRGFKRVIDVSGDGSNNRGRDVREARDEAVRAGVIINGLPIVSLEYDLDKYYFNNVIGGPGSFIVPADSYDNFAQAVLRKLILEIASADAFKIPPQTPARRQRTKRL